MRIAGISSGLARRWRVGLLVILVVGATIVAITVLGERRGPVVGQEQQGAGAPPGRDLVLVRRQTLITEVPLEGKLVFTNTAELTFDVAGKVGELVAVPGQQVQQGQLLARMDATNLSSLEAAVAEAKVELDQAQDDMEKASERFATTPVAKAQFEQDIADARLALDNAQDDLDDFLTDHRLALALAQWNLADARVALDTAQDALDDISVDHDKDLASGGLAQAEAQVALDKAQDALADYGVDYQEELTAARKAKADAETALEVAEDALTDAVIPLGNTAVFDEDATDLLQRRQVAVEAASATLTKSEEDLVRLEAGPDRLQLQQLEAAVTASQENLTKAQRDVVRVGQTPDAMKALRVEAGVAVAQTALSKAQAEVDRKAVGPDAAELAAKQKKVATLERELDELLNGPESLEVGLTTAEVAHAQAALADALEDLEGASVRAPFNGVVALVGAEVDDVVTKDSRIVTVVDPGLVQIDGLVGGAELRLVQLGAKARVAIAALPGAALDGVVTTVAAEPRTERGVITYGVTIQVTVPQGLEVPVTPSGVEVVVLNEVKDALAVPRRAVYRSLRQPVVSVLNGQGALEERRLVLGDGNGQWVTVRQGLSEGDQVVMPKESTLPSG